MSWADDGQESTTSSNLTSTSEKQNGKERCHDLTKPLSPLFEAPDGGPDDDDEDDGK